MHLPNPPHAIVRNNPRTRNPSATLLVPDRTSKYQTKTTRNLGPWELKKSATLHRHMLTLARHT